MQLVKYFFAFSSVLLALTNPIMAQEEVCLWKTVDDQKSIYFLDSMSLLESSIQVHDARGIAFAYEYDLNTGKLTLIEDKQSPKDSLLICFEKLPFWPFSKMDHLKKKPYMILGRRFSHQASSINLEI